MSRATRLGDRCTGHDACPPSRLVEASRDVFINSRGAGRLGDRYAPHSCLEHSIHLDSIAKGSISVFINNKPAGRVGDSVRIAGRVAEGSSNVYIGG